MKFVKEDMMGGVGAPMATLNNTPGVGTAVPPTAGGVGSGDSWGNKLNKKPHTQANKPNLKMTKKKKKVIKKVVKEDLDESNINPYDKLGVAMAKQMGVKPPFKKKKSKRNQNAVKQQKFEHQIITLDDFMNEMKRGLEPKDAMGIGLLSELKEFKDYFSIRYSHISYDASDKELLNFLSQPWLANRSMASKADMWSDHILSQGLGDVQE